MTVYHHRLVFKDRAALVDAKLRLARIGIETTDRPILNGPEHFPLDFYSHKTKEQIDPELDVLRPDLLPPQDEASHPWPDEVQAQD